MAETIWKFPIFPSVRPGEYAAEMPKGALVLSAGFQEKFVVWALVDRDAPRQTRWFFVLGTDHDAPSTPEAFRQGAKLVGRVEITAPLATLQFHVFDTGAWRPALERPDPSQRVEMPRG